MRVPTVAAFALILPIIMGMALPTPAVAVPASPTQYKLIAGDQSATVQKVDCRRYVHTHRRCTVWQGGACRRWVTYTHRCG